MTTDPMLEARTQRRQQLRANGYTPLPLYGKQPPEYGKNNQRGGLVGWTKLTDVSYEQIAMWARMWPTAINTGVLCRNTPTLDLDIMHEPAAVAVEEFIGERYEQRGWLLVRIGKAPKRAILFSTDQPFPKITVNLTAPNGSAEEKLEFLCDGQQVVVDGIHPETRQPYRWFGGEPWRIRRDELPYINELQARTLINDAATLLTTAYGYTRTAAAPKSNGVSPGGGGEAVWKFHLDNIRAGRGLHDSVRELAAMMICSGMDKGAAIHLLGALTESADICHDARWEARYRDVPRAVDSAVKKYRRPAPSEQR